MTAIIKNITIDQGADYQRPFFILDENGDPIDLAGALAAMQISINFGFPAILTLTTSNGSLIIGAETGTITPIIPAAVTTALIPGTYVYDVKLVFSSGRTVRPYQGTATVSPEVTIIVPIPSPPPPPPPSSNNLTEEDGTTPLTEEDGTTPLTQE